MFLDGRNLDMPIHEGITFAQVESMGGQLELSSLGTGVLQQQIAIPLHSDSEVKAVQPAGTKHPTVRALGMWTLEDWAWSAAST